MILKVLRREAKEKMNKNNVEVDVLVNNAPVKVHYLNGKSYIEAKKGTEYSIRVKNNTYNDILAVPSIDGVSALDGEVASPDSGGYVISARSSFEIKGFRKDLSTVGNFKFTSKEKAYSKEVGLDNNNGIIGVVIFAKKDIFAIDWDKIEKDMANFPPYIPPTPIPWNPYPRPPFKPYWGEEIRYSTGRTSESSSVDNQLTSNCNSVLRSKSLDSIKCSSISNSVSESPNFDIGTSWGKKTQDSVVTTTFERGNQIAFFEIFYASRESLEKIGIKFKKENAVAFPSAFPQFAKPPKNWE